MKLTFRIPSFRIKNMMNSPHAIIDPNARLGKNVVVGPFCVIGPDVEIGDGCMLHNNVTITGHTRLGAGNVIHPNAVIGGPPQDRKYKGAPTELVIGSNNLFREAVTIHIGTEKGGGITRIGSNNMLMVNAHLGHDVQMGNSCTLANNVMVAGHVIIGDNVAMMGGVGVHHFVTIGEYAYIGGYSRVHHDVPPFCKLDGADAVRGLNTIGLRRAGFAEGDIEALEDAVRSLFYKEKPFNVAMQEFDLMNGLNPHVKRMVDFLRKRNAGRHGRYLEGLRAK
jgi:UDP-N-acetylglucosamine acyltransferase